MHRILLTLLALLTGLSASGTPAVARMCMGDGPEIGAVETQSDGELAAIQVQRALLPAVRRAVITEERSSGLPVREPIYIATVLIGIDRARQ